MEILLLVNIFYYKAKVLHDPSEKERTEDQRRNAIFGAQDRKVWQFNAIMDIQPKPRNDGACGDPSNLTARGNSYH